MMEIETNDDNKQEEKENEKQEEKEKEKEETEAEPESVTEPAAAAAASAEAEAEPAVDAEAEPDAEADADAVSDSPQIVGRRSTGRKRKPVNYAATRIDQTYNTSQHTGRQRHTDQASKLVERLYLNSCLVLTWLVLLFQVLVLVALL